MILSTLELNKIKIYQEANSVGPSQNPSVSQFEGTSRALFCDLPIHISRRTTLQDFSVENSILAFKPNCYKLKILPKKYGGYQQISARFKIDNSMNWMKLKCFDSISLEESNNAAFLLEVLFRALHFCPTPEHQMVNQYIAVASSDLFFNSHLLKDYLSYSDTKSSGGFASILEPWAPSDNFKI
ncbi:hypothetical protein CEXT_356471 [Caerostris extrusa]|uniref:Uncharacterized protein n=1 Tax=Caerostris extrusa TaxID=172846 RepID=A0AAV4XT03_CAEEX|nr:hypothetical protein CEXT_356471 [Caerostris extrusa]